MTDSTPPGGLDSPPNTGTPQPLPPPTPALPSRGRQAPSTPAPAPRPARRRTRTEGKGRRRTPGHRPPRLPTSTPPRRPSATSRQQPPARIPSRLESATASNPHDTTKKEERGRRERKGRRATDEEPRQRTRNFFARPYIGRTPPRYTPKDTPAACILHRLQRPFFRLPCVPCYLLSILLLESLQNPTPKTPDNRRNERPPACTMPTSGRGSLYIFSPPPFLTK